MRSRLCGTIVAVFAVVLMTAPASAVLVLSNLHGTPTTTGGTNLGLGIDAVDRTKGVGLTTGTDPLTFNSMTAIISNTTPASTLSGGIFSSVANNPGVQLAAFTPVPIGTNVSVQQVQLTVPGGFTLLPATSYWFVLDGPSTTNSLLWNQLNPNIAPTANGVTFVGYRFSSNGGSTWANSTIFNGMGIDADIVPEPTSLGALAVAGVLALRRRRAC